MFGSKEVCSLKIAQKAVNLFPELHAQLDKGISDIKTNREKRVALREELKEKLRVVTVDIQKDDENIAYLEGKKVALDQLI